jgi:hypothetical protein
MCGVQLINHKREEERLLKIFFATDLILSTSWEIRWKEEYYSATHIPNPLEL